jgi:AP-4 complex subunit sigma-1
MQAKQKKKKKSLKNTLQKQTQRKDLEEKNRKDKMIRYILLVNKQGQTRVAKYYEYIELDKRTALEGEIVRKCLSRNDSLCSILEYQNYKVVYRRYASLFFIVGVDDSENELGVLELIHQIVETLDAFFENVCELDVRTPPIPTHLISTHSLILLLDHVQPRQGTYDTRRNGVERCHLRNQQKQHHGSHHTDGQHQLTQPTTAIAKPSNLLLYYRYYYTQFQFNEEELLWFVLFKYIYMNMNLV